MPELKRRVVKDGEKIYFKAVSKNYGRAEFGICPIYKYGKLKELHLYPKQQADVSEYFVYEFKHAPIDWVIQSWKHKGMEVPEAWMYYWCKEHKCLSFSVYVPKDAKHFEGRYFSGFSLIFSN